ncbi:transcriptional regulator [Salmonella enterica subsp. enterica]|nr:transcriptional regulator [Salmonella enterica]EAW1170538.1 transcriptional regulator [Salmonella enterica subsp. enterica]
MAVTAAKPVTAFRIQSMAVNLSRLTTRTMNVNTGHETLSQSDHYTSIQPIRGITNSFNSGQVVFRPINGEAPTLALLMAWKKGELKPALRGFIELAQRPLVV